MSNSRNRVFARIAALVLAVAFFTPLVASAANITSGSLTLGDSRPGQTTTYAFSGSGFSGTAINCIQLRFAVNADGTGGVPSGVTTTGVTLDSSTLITVGDWSVGNAAGAVRATRVTATAPAGNGNIVWGGIVNGNTANTTYYGLFNTYTNTDCSTGPVDSTVVTFMYKDGALVSLTVDPMLAFTVAGVADSETVNGADISLTSTASAINFARTVTAATNGISAHDVTVETNGNGFTVYLKQSGNLSNGTHTITPWTGTNAVPSLISGTGEMWAYTTQDSTLGGTGGATRFTSASNWAGMPTVNELVADSGTLGTQTTRVGHQLGIDSSTPAGNYSTTLVYTAAGSY